MPEQPSVPWDRRVRQGQRLRLPKRTQEDLFCSMRGHRAIAEAALPAPQEPDSSTKLSAEMQDALQSLLQDMQVSQQFRQLQCWLGICEAADPNARSWG